jgi:hypothetical protein
VNPSYSSNKGPDLALFDPVVHIELEEIQIEVEEEDQDDMAPENIS